MSQSPEIINKAAIVSAEDLNLLVMKNGTSFARMSARHEKTKPHVMLSWNHWKKSFMVVSLRL